MKEQRRTRRSVLKSVLAGMGVLSISRLIFRSKPLMGGEKKELLINLQNSQYGSLRFQGGTLALDSNALDRKGLLLYRANEKEVLVYSRRCTHRGCQLRAFEEGISKCPCHGAAFGLDGDVLSGPAKRPLKKYQGVLDGDQLIISER